MLFVYPLILLSFLAGNFELGSRETLTVLYTGICMARAPNLDVEMNEQASSASSDGFGEVPDSLKRRCEVYNFEIKMTIYT